MHRDRSQLRSKLVWTKATQMNRSEARVRQLIPREGIILTGLVSPAPQVVWEDHVGSGLVAIPERGGNPCLVGVLVNYVTPNFEKQWNLSLVPGEARNWLQYFGY